MPQITLHAPDITCDHCIATIRGATDGVPGARFVSGDAEARSFVVEIASGGVLDVLGSALSDAGYPLADGADVTTDEDAAHGGGADPRAVGWQPSYRVTRTAVGADVNYQCYCGCDAGFALDRARAQAAPESCCCGNHMLVGRDAGTRLRTELGDPAAYRVEVEPVTMPWGQPLEVALAIPTPDAAAEVAHG